MRTFIFNGFNLNSHLIADSVWNSIGLLIDRIVEEHTEQYNSVRLLKLMIELRDTLRQWYGKQITVSISLQPPEKFVGKGNEIVMGYEYDF